MSERVLIGVLTPSSNTRLEPLVTRIIEGLPKTSAPFSRFRVVQISLDPAAMSQFEHEPILAAAELLADAHVDVIAWTGTAGGWRGMTADQELCNLITARTGIPATTSTLALIEALQRSGHKTLGLVTPCPDDMQAKVEETFARAGFETVASRNLGIASNWDLAELGAETFDRLTGEVATAGPDVISTYCTNFNTPALVSRWEREYAIPVYDSISVAVWKSLQLAGVDASRVTGWGSLFSI